jgi:hypothetical protein
MAGIDAGKTTTTASHDESGRRLLSRRVANDKREIIQLLADVLDLGDEVTWGIALADGEAALAIAILFNHDQPVHYISGRAIHRASESYRGEGKTDAKDAAIIADQVRIRRDLYPLRTGGETSPTSRSSPAAAWTWSPTAPAPSIGSAPNSPASSLAWSGPWTSPTLVHSPC